MQTIITLLGLMAAVRAAPAGLQKRITHNGVATYYTQNGNAGSCGQYHGDGDYIGALGNYWMESSTNYCGRQIQITNTGGGQDNNGQGTTIIITVADTCDSCDENHIDLAEGPFQALTGGNLDPPGEFNIAWHFCNVDGQC